jgi:hypothetical protein
VSLLGKVDAAIVGVVIFALGLVGGWTLHDKAFVMAKRGSMLMPDKGHGVYCIIKGADVVCRFMPPDSSAVQSSDAQQPSKGVARFTPTMDNTPRE